MAPRSNKGPNGKQKGQPSLSQISYKYVPVGSPVGRGPSVAVERQRQPLALEGARHCSAHLSTSPEDLTIGPFRVSRIPTAGLQSLWDAWFSFRKVPLQLAAAGKRTFAAVQAAGNRMRIGPGAQVLGTTSRLGLGDEPQNDGTDKRR